MNYICLEPAFIENVRYRKGEVYSFAKDPGKCFKKAEKEDMVEVVKSQAMALGQVPKAEPSVKHKAAKNPGKKVKKKKIKKDDFLE